MHANTTKKKKWKIFLSQSISTIIRGGYRIFEKGGFTAHTKSGERGGAVHEAYMKGEVATPNPLHISAPE